MLTWQDATACSMGKVTYNGRTYVGNNEDSWHTDPRIWFEPAESGKLGACYVGYADKWPQGGMNTAGLVYDAFTMYDSHVEANGKPVAESLPKFLREIMQTCKTVDDVHAYAIQFDRKNFDRAMMLFVDSTGKYLVMEADTMVIGTDDQFILANFSFARTQDPATVELGRYKRGRAFLQNNAPGGIDFCRALMDTMSECRARKGDGTLYTSLYDIQRKEIYLCFYHDYTKMQALSLTHELAKGEHYIEMASLFPYNSEFEELKAYITPTNTISLLPFMFRVVVVLIVIAGIQAAQWFRQLHLAPKYLQYYRISLAIINALLGIYIWVIMNEPGVFYFPVPYYEAGRGWVNMLSYMPIVLLITMAASGWFVLKGKVPLTNMGRFGYIFNLAVWLLVCFGFGYWGLFAVI
jgi:hypothetical protein